MEEVEMFLAPLTARSKVREVLRGLVATRQVHTISLGHAPHFYVAGTLPEFAVAAHGVRQLFHAGLGLLPALSRARRGASMSGQCCRRAASTAQFAASSGSRSRRLKSTRPGCPPRASPQRQRKPSAPRPHFSRPAAHSRDRKPAQSSSAAALPAVQARTPGVRPRGPPQDARPTVLARPPARAGLRMAPSPPTASARRARTASSSTNGSRSNGNGSARNHASKGFKWRSERANPLPQRWASVAETGTATDIAAAPSRQASPARQRAVPAWCAKAAPPRKDARPDARASRGSRKPALAAGAKAGNQKRYGFTAPAKKSAGRSTKKRG